MTLQERLQIMPPDECVYLGSKYGGGFFYIGPAKDAVKAIKDVGDNTKELRRIEALMDKEVNAIKRLKDLFDVNKHKEYLQRLAERYADLDAENNPFLEREIVEEYPRLFCPPLGTIIKVNGTLNGGFWFLEEYISGKVEYEGA